jgi:hypothetical protein
MNESVNSFEVDPLRDERWSEFVDRHPRSSIFHTKPWLQALHDTYGYTPLAYTTSPPRAEIANGVVFCEVSSWLTGRRLVSLPFTDHCDPLVDHFSELQALFNGIEYRLRNTRQRYIELRPLHLLELKTSLYHSTYTYLHHVLDLNPNIDTLFRCCHKNSVQRKIIRAQGKDLTHNAGRSESLLRNFYALFLLTRRRHQLPSPPLQWFRNLIRCLGEALLIRVAFHKDQPVAAILMLNYKNTSIYKYGCSDTRLNNLGGTQLLLWQSIQDAKTRGLSTLDLGRSDCKNEGLITFKDRWGATRFLITYSRYGASRNALGTFIESGTNWKVKSAQRLFTYAPDVLLSATSNVFYKHVGLLEYNFHMRR